ncbi:MAG TPA: C4-dicarboxylate ABC transporter substrate-binding protein [Peptococcaceae bacterium]|nr:MAG: Extracellular solute-binding protein, family 7 [Clostridia bacterium 41_269]HBT20384.1 C4-dicarboxylate ABC transporter substrate-binding protein [Peptococcaceae bacterium]
MKKRNLLKVIAVLLLSMLVSAGCGGKGASEESSSKEGESIVLNYAFFAPANTFPAKQMEKWKEEVEKRTNGRVKVQLFPGGTLLTEKNMYDGVKNGVADIGLSVTTYEPGRFPLLAISDMPSGYPNAKVASQVVYDLVHEFTPEAFKDLKIITVFATEPSYLQTVKPVRNLEDLKGMQLRIAGALTPVLKSLGASPVGMAMAEVPEALQTGIIKGYVSSREVLMDLKLAEQIKYVTDYPLTINTFVAVMNKDVWESLPEDIKKVIDDLSREMAVWTGEYMDNHVREALEWAVEEEGLEVIKLSPQEKEKWDRILKPIQDNYVKELEAKGYPAEEYRDRLYELIEKYSSS